MHLTLAHLFCCHAFASFDKQLSLSDLVGHLDWQFDLNAGTLSFAAGLRWRAELLGTESEEAGTWLWGWANPSGNIPPAVVQAAQAMKELGQRHGIPELTQSGFPLDGIDGHFLALVASGVCGADAYYRAPYDGGAAYLLIKDPSFPRPTQSAVERVVAVCPRAVSSLPILNHRIAFTAYLGYYGLAFHVDGNSVVVEENDEPVLTAVFDGQYRLTRLDATLKPPAQA